MMKNFMNTYTSKIFIELKKYIILKLHETFIITKLIIILKFTTQYNIKKPLNLI